MTGRDPEAPDLEVVKEFLEHRIAGQRISSARVIKPSVLRSFVGDFAYDVGGRTIRKVERRGKFLLLWIAGDRVIAINPMLTGALQHCLTDVRSLKRTCVTLTLSSGYDLRYLDDRQMGSVYYTSSDRLD